jgi:hypothetical protein
LPRGFPVEQLNILNADRGSVALLQALEAVSAGQPGIPQDDQPSTPAPLVAPGTSMVDPSWDVERVWHFLAGLFPRFIEPLCDSDGTVVNYGSPISYERIDHDHTAGTVRRDSLGWRLYCAGGVVTLAPPGASHAERNRHA